MKKNDSDYALNINLTCIYPLEGDCSVTAKIKDSDGLDIECESVSDDPDEALGDVIFDLISSLSETNDDETEIDDLETKIKEYEDKIKSLEIDNKILSERLKDTAKRLDAVVTEQCKCVNSNKDKPVEKEKVAQRPRGYSDYSDIYEDMLSSFFGAPFLFSGGKFRHSHR